MYDAKKTGLASEGEAQDGNDRHFHGVKRVQVAGVIDMGDACHKAGDKLVCGDADEKRRRQQLEDGAGPL